MALDRLEELTKQRKILVQELDKAYAIYNFGFIVPEQALSMVACINDLKDKIYDIDNEIWFISHEPKSVIDKDCVSNLVGDRYPCAKKTESSGYIGPGQLNASNTFPPSDGYKLSDFHMYIDDGEVKVKSWNGSEYVDIEPYDKSEYIEALEEKVKSLTKELNEIKEDNSDMIRTDENGRIIW